MKFLLDHCVPNRVGVSIAGAGHQVIRLRECLPVDSPDHVVLQQATELEAVLISLNGDFADITTYPPGNQRGIVALQIRNHPESIAPITVRLLDYLQANPNQHGIVGKLLLVEAHRIRIRT